jgi:hypothetical protein
VSADQAASDESEVIDFAGVRFGPDEVVEMDGQQVMVRVAKQEIRRIDLRHGFYSAHPIVQVVAGLVLTCIGVLPAMHLVVWLGSGGTFHAVEAFLVAFVFLGPWLVYDAARRGPHLVVRTGAGQKRLILDKTVDPETLERFLTTVEGRFGYAIKRPSTEAARARD